MSKARDPKKTENVRTVTTLIATTSSHSYLITIGKNRVTQITLIFPAVIEQRHSVGQAEPDQISIFRLSA